MHESTIEVYMFITKVSVCHNSSKAELEHVNMEGWNKESE